MAAQPSDSPATASRTSSFGTGRRGIFNRTGVREDITTEKGEGRGYLRYWSFTAYIEDHFSEGIDAAREDGVSTNFTRDEMSYLRSCIGTPAGDKSVIREAKTTIDHPGTPTVLVDGRTFLAVGCAQKVSSARHARATSPLGAARQRQGDQGGAVRVEGMLLFTSESEDEGVVSERARGGEPTRACERAGEEPRRTTHRDDAARVKSRRVWLAQGG